MTVVNVKPMPDFYRKIKKVFWPGHPPLFTDVGPEGISNDDIELACELFGLLDQESQSWYGGQRFIDNLKMRLK